MKVVILAGGYGTRLAEETVARPKPMVDVGGMPILWHIMKIYSTHGFNDFVVLLGYKGYMIKEYFANYLLHRSDVTIDLANRRTTIINNFAEPWTVTLLDTGTDTMTGGRILRARAHLGDGAFLCTYGDGLTDASIRDELAFHRSHGKLMTMLTVQPEGKYGSVVLRGDVEVSEFVEKPRGDGAWINGGFFICEPDVFDYLDQGDSTIFERRPLETLAKDGQIRAYRHHGFWRCMDTLRDKHDLDHMWATSSPPWKVWS